MKQWSIDVPSSKVVATGVAALERLEAIVRMTPEELAALGKKTWAQIDADLKRFETGAQAVLDRGTDGGLHPAKALEYQVNRVHQAIRAGADRAVIEGSIIGFDMTAVNAADHSYRSGDAVRDAVTEAANEMFGHDLGAGKNIGMRDSVTRLNNTNVVICGVGEQALTAKWPAFKALVMNKLAGLASERNLPIRDFSKFDLLYAYTADATVATGNTTPGAIETQVARHIAELSAGEKMAGAARARSRSQATPIYKDLLTAADINRAAQDSFYLFHAPEVSRRAKVQDIPALDSGKVERPPFEITAQGLQNVMRSSHRFGFLKGLSSVLQEFIADTRRGATDTASALQAKAAGMLDVIRSGQMNTGVDLSRYNYRFSDGKTGVMLKPQHLGEEIARQARELRAGSGPNAEIEFHVFFSELRKAGDYFSSYKSNLADGNYRMTLDIPLKGLAQAGLGGGTQSVVGGDEVVWVRMEVKGRAGDPKFSPDRIQHVVNDIQRQFERIHKKRPFQPSEKVPFEGGKYNGVRFGFAPDGTLVVERPKGVDKKAVLQKTVKAPGFAELISAHFGPQAAAALGNPKKIRVVADLGAQGTASRHKVWTVPGSTAAEIYLQRGKTPPHLTPKQVTFGIDVAHGKTSDPRDIFRLISKLGHAVSGAKTNGGRLVSGVKMGFWDKVQTRGEYRLAGGGLSWVVGDVVSSAVVGGIQYLVSGKTHELSRLMDPATYATMAKDFASTTAIAKSVEAGGKLVFAKPGVALTGARAYGVQGTAALATALLPMALRGELSATQAAHAVASMGSAMLASSLVMKGLRGASLLSAESGYGLIISAAIEFGVMKGYQAIQEHRAMTRQHDELRSHLANAMRELDRSILALERPGHGRAKAEDRVARAYGAFQRSYQEYVSFVALYKSPEGEAMLDAIKARDAAVERLEHYQKASSVDVVQQDENGNVVQLGLPNEGFETTLPPVTAAGTRALQKDIDAAQARMDKTGDALHAAWAQRNTASIRTLSPREMVIDSRLSIAADPKTPELIIMEDPILGKPLMVQPARDEHAHTAQLSRDPDVFQAQLLKFIEARITRIVELVPDEKLRSITQAK